MINEIIIGNSTNELSAAIEEEIKQHEQIQIKIEQYVYEGVYTRTSYLPAGSLVVGVTIKIPTTMIVSGNMNITIGDGFKNVQGYGTIHAEKNRKTTVAAIEDSVVTMVFKTDATTVEEAEKEFTDGWRDLQTYQRRLT